MTSNDKEAIEKGSNMTMIDERTTTTDETHQEDANPPRRGTLHTVDGKGTAPITWDPSNAAEVAFARARFAELKAHGYLAYASFAPDAATRKGPTGEVVHEFREDATSIIMRPQLVGG